MILLILPNCAFIHRITKEKLIFYNWIFFIKTTTRSIPSNIDMQIDISRRLRWHVRAPFNNAPAIYINPVCMAWCTAAVLWPTRMRRMPLLLKPFASYAMNYTGCNNCTGPPVHPPPILRHLSKDNTAGLGGLRCCNNLVCMCVLDGFGKFLEGSIVFLLFWDVKILD